jgi:Bacterial type II/III secretion system short domain
MRPIRSALAAVLAGFAIQALGQHALEIIALKYRTVDQVLPVLRPLLEPGGTLTGQQNQLIVRASPANLAELRRALETIDRPLRRLQILVRFDDAADAASQGVEASGRIGNDGSRIDVRAHDRRTLADERVDQRVQVLEGGRAYIAMGQYAGIHETATGFEVVPRVSGQTVFLEIAQQRETPAQQQRLATTVSARLGEWFELAGVRGIAQSRGTRSAESLRIWVKVEEIGN